MLDLIKPASTGEVTAEYKTGVVLPRSETAVFKAKEEEVAMPKTKSELVAKEVAILFSVAVSP